MEWREGKEKTAGESSGQACSEFEMQLALLAAGDELDVAEQAELAEHLAHCADCTEALAREKECLRILSENRIEPDAALLASCRASLEDALDRKEEYGWLGRAVRTLIPAGLTTPRPAWTAAVPSARRRRARTICAETKIPAPMPRHPAKANRVRLRA